jgi:hypothetical protein
MLDDVRVLPALIVTSNVATNSVNMESTWSSPASTLIMSELGFGYFFVRIEAKNAVKVYTVSLSCKRSAMKDLHQGRAHLPEQFQLWYVSQLERTTAAFVTGWKVSKHWIYSYSFFSHLNSEGHLVSVRLACVAGLPSPAEGGRTPARIPRSSHDQSRLPRFNHISQYSNWKSFSVSQILPWTKHHRAQRSLAGKPQVWLAEWGEMAPYLMAAGPKWSKEERQELRSRDASIFLSTLGQAFYHKYCGQQTYVYQRD